MKKKLILIMILAIVIALIPDVCKARNKDVTITSASITNGVANVSGITSAPAVMVQIRDTNGDIVAMMSTAVVNDRFSEGISGSYTSSAIYSFYVADYEGGTFAVTQAAATVSYVPVIVTPVDTSSDEDTAEEKEESPKEEEASEPEKQEITTEKQDKTEDSKQTVIKKTVKVKKKKTYKVAKGDTLSKIAAKLKVSVKELQSINKIKNVNLIYPGQKIVYYVTVKKTVEEVTDKETDSKDKQTAEKKDSEKKAKTKTYVVKKGDTLSKIAKKLGLTLKEVISKNKIKNPDLITPGQKIKY